ncbi:MAG TPA: NUDIX hydrolase [Candidatus Dojkabacteria bacterium]|nr:NUDIX hydrolase [Candidatus Dojkabacteria bacterium]
MNQRLHQSGEIRLGVECCIKYKNKILLQKRSPSSKFFPNYLAFPGGHIDVGEDAKTACVREVMEETGVDISNLDVKFIISSINTHVDKQVVWVIYAFRVELEDEVIPINTLEGDCAWYDLDALDLNEIVPPVRDYFNELIRSVTQIFTSAMYENGLKTVSSAT